MPMWVRETNSYLIQNIKPETILGQECLSSVASMDPENEQTTEEDNKKDYNDE